MPRAIGQSRWLPYWFLAPFLTVFCVFVAYPLLQSGWLALSQTYGPRTSVFVGGDNFRELLQDPSFWRALSNTCLYALGSLFIQLPLALGLALLLNRADLRWRGFWRLVFFAPALVGVAFVAVLFGPILAKDIGLLNTVLNATCGDLWDTNLLEVDWLNTYVLPALIIISLWMYVGFNMVYFLAALQNVDASLTDAARIDGAGALARFWHVTLPEIRNVGSFVVLLSLIGSFQLFELPYVLLNFSSGPQERGLTMVLYLYQWGFKGNDLGYASAIGWALAMLLIALAVVQQRLVRRFED